MILLLWAGIWATSASAAAPAETVSLVVNGGFRVCTAGKPGLGCRMPDMTAARAVKVALQKMPSEEGAEGDAWSGTWSHEYSDPAAKFTLKIDVQKTVEPESSKAEYSLIFRILPDQPSDWPETLQMTLADMKGFNRFRWDGAPFKSAEAGKEVSPVLYFSVD